VTEPRWLSLTVALAIHSDQIKEHGGSLGLRDRGLLESALARPLNLLNYQPDSDVFALAASYGFGIARNHPFVDGNKRVAFQAMYVFLGLNGWRIESDEPEVVRMMLALASGNLEEGELGAWLREHTVRRRGKRR
jgi:death-on-curing protein